MRRSLLGIALATLLAGLLGASMVKASERVLFVAVLGGDDAYLSYPRVIGVTGLQGLNDQNSFAVYTVREIDGKFSNVDARDAERVKTITELQDILNGLRHNLKDLADVNDALAKRVDELDKRITRSPE